MNTEWLNNIILFFRSFREFLANSTLSTAIGAVAVCVFLYINRSKFFDKETVVNAALVFLSVIAIPPGLAVMLLSLDREMCQVVKIEQKVFFVGGLVLVMVGLQGIRKNFKQD